MVLGGVGRHEAWVLLHEPEGKTEQARAKTLFVTEFIHGLIMAMEKTSILLLYIRIFRVQRWFLYLGWAMIAFVWLWALSELLVATFQCSPIAYQWDTTLDGTCINQIAFYQWISIPNIIHDVALLAIPSPMIWRLQVSLT